MVDYDKDYVLEEIKIKDKRLEGLAGRLNLEGVALFKYCNYAWFTAGGSNRVVTGSERGCSFLLWFQGKKYVFAPNNEIARIEKEQVGDQGFIPITYNWHNNPVVALKELVGNSPIGADIPLPDIKMISDEIDCLRFSLTPAEIKRAKDLATICSDEIAYTCATIKKGHTEYQIAGDLSGRLLAHGVRPAVLLVGTDERLLFCRHPVLTDKRLEKYGLISLVGEKGGLHITLTRSFHIGAIPQELREKHQIAAQVDGAMMASTLLGHESNRAFEECKRMYRELGYPKEWQLHHQGGAIGYNPREYRVGERNEMVEPNQMFGWNPTVQNTKSESTILINPEGKQEILDTVPLWWPTTQIQIDNKIFNRPQILSI